MHTLKIIKISYVKMGVDWLFYESYDFCYAHTVHVVMVTTEQQMATLDLLASQV